MKRPSAPQSFRYDFVRYVFIFLGGIILLRLFSLQIIDHGKYETLAAKQHLSRRELIAERGQIFASDGTPLATTQESYLLFVVPPEVQDVEELAALFIEKLPFKHKKCFLYQPPDQSEGCELEEEEWEELREQRQENLENAMTQEGRLWVPIMRNLPITQRDAWTEMNVPGVYFQAEKTRSYPEKYLAAHVLGFVGSDEFGRPTGYFGLEGYFNGELTGTHGSLSTEIDASGKPIPIGQFHPIPPTPGMNLTLTIRRELQYMLDDQLKQGVERYHADWGSYILLNPKTGEVWALGNYPTFDPGNWVEYLGDESDVAKVNVYKNHAISDNYEPGSVMKVITVAAGLDTNTIETSSTYNDTGPMRIQGYDIRTWNNQYHGVIDVGQILQLSNNPGAAHVGLLLGKDRLWEYMQRFGIGTPTRIDLQGEEAGLTKPIQTWRDIDVATAAFGQGISLTPLQLVNAVATIANDGVRMKPYIVKEMHDPSSDARIVYQPQEVERAISTETAQEVKRLMRQVVDQGEFSWFVEHEGLSNYPLAGKTGTAQIPIPGGYDRNQTNVTFVGFAPADDPVFVLLVRLHKPKTSTYSAETAVPLWLKMGRELITYFGISPQ